MKTSSSAPGLRAARERKTLNAVFRDWLERYAGAETDSRKYAQLMKSFGHVSNSKRVSREEMNVR